MKASFHASGRCHIRAPDPQQWRGSGEPPEFLQAWDIDPSSNYSFPFSVVFPEQELRSAEWPRHKNKGAIWIPASAGKGVEVGVFFVRALGDLSAQLQAGGWHTQIVDAMLPDERRLLVVAGEGYVPTERLAELKDVRAAAKQLIERESLRTENPRFILVADANVEGTRKFVEAAVLS